jgi:hypothetical protein
MSNRIDIQYTKISYLMLAWLLISFISFAPAYFMRLNGGLPGQVHIHFVLMFIWMLTLITQPLLIRRKNYRLHRIVGRLSFMLFPLLILSGYVMVQYAYHRDLSHIAASNPLWTHEQVLHQAGINMGLPLYYLFGLLIFYSLGILWRKTANIHAKFMIATSMMVTGPIIDRFLYYTITWMGFKVTFPLEYVAFVIIDVVLLALLWQDLRRDYSKMPTVFLLILAVGGQVYYFSGLASDGWQKWVLWLL